MALSSFTWGLDPHPQAQALFKLSLQPPIFSLGWWESFSRAVPVPCLAVGTTEQHPGPWADVLALAWSSYAEQFLGLTLDLCYHPGFARWSGLLAESALLLGCCLWLVRPLPCWLCWCAIAPLACGDWPALTVPWQLLWWLECDRFSENDRFLFYLFFWSIKLAEANYPFLEVNCFNGFFLSNNSLHSKIRMKIIVIPVIFSNTGICLK